MIRLPYRHMAYLTLAGALFLALPSASAEPPPMAPGDGRIQHFEIRAKAGQVAMLPLGEGDRTGQHITVRLSDGALVSAKYQAACGRVLLHGPDGERIPAFAPTPSSEGAVDTSRVCGEAGCGCANAQPGTIHVTKPPSFLVSDSAAVMARSVQVLPGGDTPQPVAEDTEPGCFGWLELAVDATGLRVGTQIVATVEAYAPGAPLSGPPTTSERLNAAVVTP